MLSTPLPFPLSVTQTTPLVHLYVCILCGGKGHIQIIMTGLQVSGGAWHSSLTWLAEARLACIQLVA